MLLSGLHTCFSSNSLFVSYIISSSKLMFFLMLIINGNNLLIDNYLSTSKQIEDTIYQDFKKIDFIWNTLK